MNKKTLYWTGGVIALIVILLIIWAAFLRNSKSPSDGSSKTLASEDNLENYMKEQDALMDKMMEDMDSVTPEGNAALDFLTGMIPHHQAAVSMSESYLKYGDGDDELKKLANDIIQAQNHEIEQMQSLITEIKEEGLQNPEQEQAYLEAYDNMMSSHHSMHSSHASPANVETAFAEGMMMHHQMAVEMAQAIMGNTDNEQVTALAQSIIETQQAEIRQMQDILKKVSTNGNAHH